MLMTTRQTFVVIIAASFASTIGGLPFNSLPILLGTLADAFGLSAQQTGLLGSVCFSGFLIGTLSAVFFMDRLSWRWLTLTSASCASATLLMSAVAPAVFQPYLWAIVGFFAALMTCLGLRIMGEMDNKERALGVRQGVELGVTALVLFLLPSYVMVNFGYAGVAITLTLIILVLGLSAFVLPHGSWHIERNTVPRQGWRERLAFPRPAWLALVGFFLYLSGQIGLWAFLERIGNGLALQPEQLGIVFSVLKLLGGAAAFSVALIGDRLGPRLPYLLVLGVIVFGLALLWGADGFLAYAMGAWIWEVGFTAGCVYQTATIARLDPQGRAIMLVPAAFAGGSMIGPAAAGLLVAQGTVPLLLMALASGVFAALLFGGVLAGRLPKTSTDISSRVAEPI